MSEERALKIGQKILNELEEENSAVAVRALVAALAGVVVWSLTGMGKLHTIESATKAAFDMLADDIERLYSAEQKRIRGMN